MALSSRFIVLLLLFVPLLSMAAQEPPPTETTALTATPFPSTTPSPQPTDLMTTPTPTAIPFLMMGDIDIGEEVSGTFPENVYEVGYLLQGVAGENISITLSGASVYGGCFRLDTPETSVGSSGLNVYDTAVISFFTLPSTGAYRIVLNQCGSISDYTLKVESVTLQSIAYEQVAEGTLSATQSVAAYRLAGHKDDLIAISLISEQFDPFLQLSVLTASAGGSVIMSNDNNGGSLNAFIGPYRLVQDGDFLITVTSSMPGSGQYRLIVNHLTPQTIHYDDSITVNITEQTPMQVFAFEGSEGDLIDIGIDSDNGLDTILTTSDSYGNGALGDDDSGHHFDPEIIQQLIYASGTYWIWVRPYAIGETGQVELTLSRRSTPSLDDQPQLVTLNSKIYLATLTFTGIENQRMQITVRRMDTAQRLPVGIITNIHIVQGGQTLLDASLQGGDTFAFEFVVPADGPVSVQLRESGSVESIYEMSLERE